MQHELQGIQAFVKIAEIGCFTRASQFLHISQPALTRRIKKLEESLGTTLFERSTRRVKLTAVGRDFLPKAKNLIDFYESSILSIKEMATHQTGVITLSCLPTAAFYFLPSVIRDYNEHYPNIRIRILEHSASDCLEAVLNGDADFGINMINITHPNIEFTPLVNEPFVLACKRDHELAKKSLVMWEDLAGLRLIGVRKSSGNRLLIDQALEGFDWQPNWFYEVRHLSTSLGMVEAGLGVAVVPSLAMPTDEHHVLVSRPLIEPVIRRTLGLVLRRGDSLSPAAEKFREMLMKLWSQDKTSPWIGKFSH
ncbi:MULTISPECIES: LysR family transcriptional regulator [Enterobacteriaceae]|jgi:DNA-binding transcriptional LysR family regulator|uniref:LysR family transcriptional regulator n=4 Tax=Enterobacteriaceae TaxID=543 RepID=A0AB35RP19_9ENTR|nr:MULTISPECIES: LysR family transcriptional regulator [Enterobacteriaceae]AUV02166.1 LysR family transcriptional regulator [Enterobacteriaceae bacterium ENNIH1]MBS6741488.1 LysR family transcriptional regulator [Enterobacteriaceae bacterium]PTA97499.1 LysR family transcriptional regulator [Kluyvera sp. Nf5]PWF51747.1 LysR family transcriptional regulator [[Kluyvera] intestini]PXW53425.1 DNA-binding transcriptional LysR family regulator [Grimontella sp. AG753]RDT51193.1 LysR family transcript